MRKPAAATTACCGLVRFSYKFPKPYIAMKWGNTGRYG
jgi:hypothetical protein